MKSRVFGNILIWIIGLLIAGVTGLSAIAASLVLVGLLDHLAGVSPVYSTAALMAVLATVSITGLVLTRRRKQNARPARQASIRGDGKTNTPNWREDLTPSFWSGIRRRAQTIKARLTVTRRPQPATRSASKVLTMILPTDQLERRDETINSSRKSDAGAPVDGVGGAGSQSGSRFDTQESRAQETSVLSNLSTETDASVLPLKDLLYPTAGSANRNANFPMALRDELFPDKGTRDHFLQ